MWGTNEFNNNLKKLTNKKKKEISMVVRVFLFSSFSVFFPPLILCHFSSAYWRVFMEEGRVALMWCHIKGPWFYLCPNYVLLITCIKVSFAVVFKMSWTQNSVRVTAWIINFHFLIDDFFSVVSSCRWPIGQLASCTFLQKETLSVHQIPDARVGEGVPVQHVPHARSATWGGTRTQSDRAASEDLVPEPEDENEETK